MSNCPIRKIIHCDCDCFYASIEMRDQPALRDRPIAVGGASERRGVIATCNYAARRFGVHSAMPSATALRLCPDLIIVSPDMDKYRAVSAQIHGIFRDYTQLIEPLSLDEAFLDVSQADCLHGSATLMAQEIRQRVREELGITISAGIAPNKFLAKIASDWNKPDGQFVILPDEVDDFVRKLPVEKLSGVGKVTAARLHQLGLRDCGELRACSEVFLQARFGKFGRRLYRLCRGIDEREVRVERIRKSLSVESTFPRDLPDLEACLGVLPELHEKMLRRLGAIESRYRVTKAFVKLKFHDFRQTTLERSGYGSEYSQYPELLAEAWARHSRAVRLIGVGVRLEPRSEETGTVQEVVTQLDLGI